MEIFDELTVDRHYAFAELHSFGMGGDDASRPRDLFAAGRESGIGFVDLVWVD